MEEVAVSDETNVTRAGAVDDSVTGAIFIAPDSSVPVAEQLVPGFSMRRGSIAGPGRLVIEFAVEEVEEQAAVDGAVCACEHVPAVLDSATPLVEACVVHPDLGIMCSRCLEAHSREHGAMPSCSLCGRADWSVGPAWTDPQSVEIGPCRVCLGPRLGDRFTIDRVQVGVVVLLGVCSDCRIAAFERADQDSEIEALERRLYPPDSDS